MIRIFKPKSLYPRDDNNEIEIDELSSENIANLYYFFMLSAAFSGYLFDIEPFNQPGVEVYKQEVRDSLNG